MYRKITISLVLSLLCLLSGAKTMGLKDCMLYAISNSTKVRIQEAAIDDARLARRDAVLRAFSPSISGSVSAYYNFGRSIDPQTNTYIMQTSFHNNYGVSAGIELFNGFEAVNNMKIAKTSLAMGRTQEQQIEADICLAVMEAYYNVLYYSELLEIYEAQVETARNALIKAEKQEELGQKGHADVVQMRADLADQEYNLISTRNYYNSTMLELKDLMFWPVGEELVIDSGMADNDSVALTGSGEAEIISEYALSHNADILLADGALRNAEMRLNTAKWQILPSLSLYAGWNTSYFNYGGASSSAASFQSQFRNNGGEYVQLSMSIPIFNRLGAHSAVRRQKNAVKVAQAEYDRTKREIEAEVHRAIQDRDGAAAAFMQSQSRSEVQEEAFYLNTKKMEQGLISSIEYQTATNNYLKAKAERLKTLCQYLIKQSVVRYYAGEEYINQ